MEIDVQILVQLIVVLYGHEEILLKYVRDELHQQKFSLCLMSLEV